MYQKKIIDTLCHLMNIGDEVDRYYATKLLGTIGNIQSIPTLIDRLHDDDIDVSIEAATTLGKMGHSDAIPALLESLTDDPNGEVKTAVVEALGRIGGPTVIAPLLEVAKNCPDNFVWDETEDWNAWWDMQLLAVKALGHQRVTEAIPILTNILIDEESQDIENEVLTALAHIGGKGEHILRQRLTQGNPRERRRAAIALGLSQSSDAHNALIQAMTDRVAEVRIAAIRALGKQRTESGLNMILLFLKDPETEVRQVVLEIITNLPIHPDHAEIVQEKLTPLLDDSSPHIRRATLKILHNIKVIPTEILEKIQLCLTDSNNEVIAEAGLLLVHLHEHTVLPTLLQILSDQQRDVTLRSQIAKALGILGNFEAIGILSWAIKDEAQPMRLAALNALMQLEKKSALSDEPPSPTPLEIIITALKGRNQNTLSQIPKFKETENEVHISDSTSSSSSNTSTLEAGSHETQTVAISDSNVPALKPSLTPSDNQATIPDTDSSNREPHYAKSTLEAIAMNNAETRLLMNESDITDPLQNHHHFSENIQEYINIAQKNIELGEHLFVSKPVDVAADIRHLSARILGESNQEQAIHALIDVLNDDDPILRREAVNALGQIAQRSPDIKELHNAFDSLITQINIGDQKMRLACVRTLGLLKNPLAISILFLSLHDDEASVRVQAIQSLMTLIPSKIVEAQQIENQITTEETETEGVKTETILTQFIELLHDNNLTVRKAAVEALAELRHIEAIDFIINAALRTENTNIHDMSHALRLLDAEQSIMKLLDELTKAPDSLHRRVVIEMLELIIGNE